METKQVETIDNTNAESEILSAISKKEPKEKQFGNVTVERTDGEKIVLPEGMGYAQARAWLEKIEKSEETIVRFNSKLKAYPYDGAYALFKAMQQKFGYADMIAEKGASGSTPPTMISVKLPDGTMVNVPWGRLQFPGLDDKSYLETRYDHSQMEFVIDGQIKRKFQKDVDALILLTEKMLKEDSLYKGNAIRVDLGFLENPTLPMAHPDFLNHSVCNIKDDDVLMTDVTRMNYAAVLLRIEQTEKCRRNGVQIKHGCLLAGPYGTGKTLLAKYTAKKAIENKWTFIYLEDARQLKHALRLAEMYAPCVVFSEDIDKAVEGSDRTSDINAILNTLDGVDTKNIPIITVLTTNHIENINKAFLRAGRIDSLITMGALTGATGQLFLQRFATDKHGKSLLNPNADYTKAAEALNGIVPAFASEVINKAKIYALYDKREILEPNDIEIASESFKEHIRLTTENHQPTQEELVARAIETVNTYGKDNKALAEINETVNRIDGKL